MAPANGSSKSRKANTAAAPASKAAPKKPVVPALPLKRHAATPSASSVANSTSVPKADKKIAQPNAKDQQPAKNGDAAGIEQTPASRAQSKVTSALMDKRVDSQDKSQAHPPPSAPASSESATTPRVDTPTTASADTPSESRTGATPSANTGPDVARDTTAINGINEKMDHSQKPSADLSAKPFRPRVPPAVSPSRYQMPPSFRPNNAPMPMPGNPEMSRGPRGSLPGGLPHGHQPHPSNGSIHFGTFHDSQTSSPAPHAGGVAAPPPGMPFPDGRQPFMGPGGSGFPPMMPYGNEMMPVTTFDNFGRPSMPYGPMDPYPPYRGNMGPGPSGPHSFHGSQSSNTDESAMFNQYSRPPLRNGAHGQAEDNQHPNARMYRGPEYPQSFPSQEVQPQMLQRPEGEEEFKQYFQQQFGNPEFADFTLELRYLDDRAAPVRIPGHRIVFAKSAELAEQLRRRTLPPSPSGSASQTLLLETGSKWIRSDSFYMAAQTLYGMPLLQHPGPSNLNGSMGITDAGSNGEQLDFALSYVAAGHILGWSPVVRRGCEVAAQLLNWQTVERALEFALEDHRDRGMHDAYKYGDGSKIILDGIVNFIVHNFPPTFELDSNVTEPVPYARLPINPGPATVHHTSIQESADSTDNIPAVQFGKARRSQKITGIQFGDFASPEIKPSMESETPKASKQAQPVSHDVLSRLLLNVPFTQLKMILESSSSGNVQGWANAEARYRIVKTAVDEREALRRRVIDAVTAGRVAETATILDVLRAPEPRESDRWGILGWQEEILPYGNADGPSLGRKWTPLVEFQAPPVAAYP